MGWTLAASSFVGVLLLAVPLAESTNNWSDSDGDGLLDGFENGAYDWCDVNCGDWLRVAGLGQGADVGLLLLVRATTREWASARSAGDQED